MDLFYRLKRKIGRYAIENLSLYATIVFGVGYVMLRTAPGISLYSRYLAFYPQNVLHGEVWRILTAVLYPPSNTGNLLLGALSIYIYFSFSQAVERSMGEFEYNVYFFGSILIGELGSVVYYLITGINYPFIPFYTHFSVFMAFAIMYPENRVLLFFLIPVKIKIIAWIEAALYLFNFLTGDLNTKISVLAAFIPVLLFYAFVNKSRGGGDIISNLRFKIKQKKRQKEWRDAWK